MFKNTFFYFIKILQNGLEALEISQFKEALNSVK